MSKYLIINIFKVCLGSCLECDSYKICIKCPEGLNRILVDDKCACDSGFYEDSNNKC